MQSRKALWLGVFLPFFLLGFNVQPGAEEGKNDAVVVEENRVEEEARVSEEKESERVARETEKAEKARIANVLSNITLDKERRHVGYSGEVTFRDVFPGERIKLPLSVPKAVFGEPVPLLWARWIDESGDASEAMEVDVTLTIETPAEAGIWRLEVGATSGPKEVLPGVYAVLAPFEQKRNGYIDSYYIGNYPTEGQGRTDRYAPPRGFFKVTEEMADIHVSKHLKLGNFFTHDQKNVWPKYVALDHKLIDKLELMIQELEKEGIEAKHLVIMSGFRTPQYNKKGLSNGRANLSRHQYGDAADVWVDNDQNWYMDDLNGDGRRNTQDARVMLRAIEQVEAKYPDLVGGAGIYSDNGAHGPFIHVDVRGQRARW